MEFSGTLAGGLSGTMHFGSDGDTIDINPIITSGTKIATFTVNEGTDKKVSYDLYAPDTVSWDDITDKPQLFSGSYNDLTNKPTLNGDVVNGNMYGQKWDTTQDVIIGYCNGQPVYRRTYTNRSFSNYIDLGDVPEWSIFNISGTIETSDAYEAQYGYNEVLMIPGYLNNNYWFRIYYMKDGFQYSSIHHPILYFEYASELSTHFNKIPLLYVDYQIKSNG